MKTPTETGYYWVCMSPELIPIGGGFGFDPVELHEGKIYKFGIGPGIPVEEDWIWGPKIEFPREIQEVSL